MPTDTRTTQDSNVDSELSVLDSNEEERSMVRRVWSVLNEISFCRVSEDLPFPQFPVSCRSGVSIVENRQSSFFSGRPMVEFILQKDIFPRDQPRSNSNGLAQEFFDLILSFRLIISCRLAEQHGKTRAQSRARVR